MKSSVLLALLMFSAGLRAQNPIPPGTILPAQLSSAIRSDKARPGDLVSARIMQDVPLPEGVRLHAGSTVIGHVVAVQRASHGTGGEISLRFDMLATKSRRILMLTNLRAMATMMDVSEAQVPEYGADRGTSEYNWTTQQIGGEIDYHGGNAVVSGSNIVGHSVANGVLVRVRATAGSRCRGDIEGSDRLQALWVFSSDACGLYDFPGVTLVHAGRTDPVGEITLRSAKGNVKIQAGSGMLLRVNEGPH